MIKRFGNMLGQKYADLKENEKGGFTLIELVVVIAIMAILALIMVPNLTAYISKAETSQLQANMKNIHTATEIVRQTSGEGLVTASNTAIADFANTEVTEIAVLDEATTETAVGVYSIYENGDRVVIVGQSKKGNTFTFDGSAFLPVE